MELRRAADALSRCQAHSLPAFLTPSISRWHLNINRINTRISQRDFSASATRSATGPSATTSPSKPAQTPKDKPEDIAASLNWIKAGTGGNRTGRSPPRTQDERQAPQPSSISDELLMNKGTSASDLLRSVNIGLGVRPNRFNLDKMKVPGPRFDAASLMKDVNRLASPPPAVKPPLRLTPTTGRTVSIGAGVDVGRGFKLLEQTVGRNGVRRDMFRQRFHERPGLKRKRLRSERWRKRFMIGFKATVSRVKELKKQGW
ncbi:MAG: hypothetical protein M1818_003577 [Claussenomyces sp. TS43310]|nr:MAG: hypothetical protein M1818_003577 [Claussenomyces sp. TS43310]